MSNLLPADPHFFEDTPVEVGQEIAVLHGGWEWAITSVVEIDLTNQRIQCKGARPGDTEACYWYNKAGQVLSEITWKPLKGKSGRVDAWKAGRLYPLTSEIRDTMRLAAKHRQLQWIMSHKAHLAIQQDWHGQIDEARLTFILERFEQALADLPQVLGENGQERYYLHTLNLSHAQV